MANDIKDSRNLSSLKVQLSYLANSYYCNYKPTKSTLKKHSILKKLKNNKDIIITHPDKGEGVVIINKLDYNRMIYDIINDKSKFKLLDGDPTINREKKLQRFLLSLKKKGMFSDEEYNKLYPTGSNIARIYGTPKIHKLSENLNNKEIIDKLKLRPIISSIGTYNYNLAKYLTKILSPYISKTHSINDTFTFVNEINNINSNNKFMTSFDIVSLYTNIPLNETIDLAVNIIKTNEPNLKINHKELKKLFLFATAETHFLFENNIYDQVDGVSMGSPLAPVLANLFMGFHESNWIRDYNGSPPLIYKRYVDDIFCLFNNENEANDFLNYLNKKHPNIKFTTESENNNTLPFLDVNIKKLDNGKFNTNIFHKKTYSGLLTNYLSFTPLTYKLALLKTLIHRTFRICNTWQLFHFDIDKLKKTLLRNKYPLKLIEDEIRNYINNKYKKTDNDKIDNDKCKQYFKLPFIGEQSISTKRKIKKLCKDLCKKIDITISFTTCKINSFMSTKTSSPSHLQSFVVYYFKCDNCTIDYVGQTKRHCSVRIREHLHADKNSHIFKHLNSNIACKNSCSESSFKIIDKANTDYALRLKEALHIKWKKPSLNAQKYHVNLKLL